MVKSGNWHVTGGDIPAEYLVQCIESLLANYLADIAKRDDLPPSDTKWLAIESGAFRANFETLKQSRNGIAKEAGLRAILSALNFSVYHMGGSKRLQEASKKNRKIQSQQAGVASGKARKKKSQETWHPHAKLLADEAWDIDPNRTNQSVREYIIEWWSEQVLPNPPGHRTLQPLVSGWKRMRDKA